MRSYPKYDGGKEIHSTEAVYHRKGKERAGTGQRLIKGMAGPVLIEDQQDIATFKDKKEKEDRCSKIKRKRPMVPFLSKNKEEEEVDPINSKWELSETHDKEDDTSQASTPRKKRRDSLVNSFNLSSNTKNFPTALEC